MKNLVSGKINIEILNDNESKVETKGNKLSLMLMLANLAESLMIKSNLNERDIKFAIDLGINGTKSRSVKKDDKDKELEELLEDLSQKLINAIIGSE